MKVDVSDQSEEDPLARWLNEQSEARAQPDARRPGGLRFAFYGRMSTVEHQDRVTFRHWQLDCATELTSGHGAIVIEYFDVGCSRRRSWRHRLQSASLLAALGDPLRGFDAIVVGEYERAFSGNQLLHLMPLLEQHGVHLWLPETDGPADRHNPTHQALIMLLGAQSKREAQRSRHRVIAAMRTQTREHGRYLGGRPPYGYRLIDAGPHPNAAHARWGRQLQRLEPDPSTAAHVRRTFTQRLAGHSLASIARVLNDDAIACPSIVDPGRNHHRTRERWTLRTVAAILANPRYTGRQVWNRQRTDGRPDARETVRWNHTKDWVISKQQAHTPLVTEQDFIATQAIRSQRSTHDGSTRSYLLTGLLRCGSYGRRMEAHWVNQRPGYRCRHGHTSSQHAGNRPRKILYLREDRIIAMLVTHPGIAGTVHSPHELATFLRVNNIAVVCDQGRCIPATGMPAQVSRQNP